MLKKTVTVIVVWSTKQKSLTNVNIENGGQGPAQWADNLLCTWGRESSVSTLKETFLQRWQRLFLLCLVRVFSSHPCTLTSHPQKKFWQNLMCCLPFKDILNNYKIVIFFQSGFAYDPKHIKLNYSFFSILLQTFYKNQWK